MKIDSAVFYTNDIDKITTFYTETLGFNLEYRHEKYSSFIFNNDVRLGIKQKEKDREVPGSQTVIISTSNIETLYEDLKSKGIEIHKELIKETWGTTFSILDRDGNKLEFLEE